MKRKWTAEELIDKAIQFKQLKEDLYDAKKLLRLSVSYDDLPPNDFDIDNIIMHARKLLAKDKRISTDEWSGEE